MAAEALFPRPVKRSLTIRGHRTSVSLEEPFWQELRRLARARGSSVNALVAEIDAMRAPPASLASAIRVWVLEALRARYAGEASGEGSDNDRSDKDRSGRDRSGKDRSGKEG